MFSWLSAAFLYLQSIFEVYKIGKANLKSIIDSILCQELLCVCVIMAVKSFFCPVYTEYLSSVFQIFYRYHL